mmetsp:Transcript_2989/g.4534  ORF Transcript_2989/g.4534 Transcript_2989/m.4534 type:complete len:522 (+) Transcript_2989:63-1628(+)
MFFKPSTISLIVFNQLTSVVANSNRSAVRALATSCPTGGILDESGKFCCISSCGVCGGFGCDRRVGGASACCTSQITQSCSNSGLLCLATESDSSICQNGGIIDSSSSFCCPLSCGQCGGYGCNSRPGGDSNCCTSKITNSCNSNGPPCKIEDDVPATCPYDGIIDSTGKICCSSSCRECGGYGCDLKPGGAANCCTSHITESCSNKSAPCILDGTNSSCPNGGIFDSSGTVCCTESCGQCGGDGCHLRPGGASQCCTSQATNSCSSNTLPCIVDNATSSSDDDDDEDSVCSDGILSEVFSPAFTCLLQYCCPKSCSECNINSLSCETEPECCAYSTILTNEARSFSDANISCRSKSPPCLVPPEDDPCVIDNPCQNGALCGLVLGDHFPMTDDMFCSPETRCECGSVGSFYGEFCELACDEGETACGLFYPPYGSFEDYRPYDKCCSADEVCVSWFSSAGTEKMCKSKDRPLSCEPNPCLNGGSCSNLNSDNRYNEVEDPYYGCTCLDGFSGVYCEIMDS